MLNERWIDVDSTSKPKLNVDSTLFQRSVPGGLTIQNILTYGTMYNFHQKSIEWTFVVQKIDKWENKNYRLSFEVKWIQNFTQLPFLKTHISLRTWHQQLMCSRRYKTKTYTSPEQAFKTSSWVLNIEIHNIQPKIHENVYLSYHFLLFVS
jgi:hypothetical protein